MGKPGFWEGDTSKLIGELKQLKAQIVPLEKFGQEIEDQAVLLDLAKEEEDEATLAEVESSLRRIGKELDRYELELLMSGEHDAGDALVSIHAGAGGTEACDWVQMLLRMYSRYLEKAGFKTETDDVQPGEEAGIRSVTFSARGAHAYGYLRAESGVHRLVRISPFDANQRRQTTFASVDVWPEVQEGEIEVKRDDLKIDTYRAGGKGGQHVNVTESAVRITHLPTGIIASCQNERSQHKNKATAMKVLLARLARLQEEKREQEVAKAYGEKGDISFGNQIRSYVLHPYTMVKDHRTGQETSQAQDVLDGDLQPFIDAWLRHRAEGKGARR
jgi:peptide chain release factor 2